MAVVIDVAVQRTGGGRLLGACVMLPAETIERFVDDDTALLKFSIERLTSSIHLRLLEQG